MQKIVIKSYETKKSLVSPIIFLIIGLTLLLKPEVISNFISYIIGGAFLALGLGKMFIDSKRFDKTTGDTFYSIIMIALGFIFIFFTGTLEALVRFAIGVWIVINGVNTIAIGANLMRIDKKSVVSLIIGFILLIIGLYTIFVENLITTTLGLVIIVYSILEIVDYFYIQAKNR